MCCKALHERHPGRGNSKAKLALVAFGERERGGVGVGLEHLDLPAARVLRTGCTHTSQLVLLLVLDWSRGPHCEFLELATADWFGRLKLSSLFL
jgi:hypothetical protein